MTEQTRIHEAGHTVVSMLEGEYAGEIELVTALPGDGFLGKLRHKRPNSTPPLTPRRLRPIGRTIAAGPMAEKLAGFRPCGTERDDKGLARFATFAQDPKQFLEETFAGVELQLRMHWGAVLGVAGLLGTLGELTQPYGIGLVRMELRKPPRPLATDADTFVRLADALAEVPELSKPLEEALLRAA